MIDLYQLLEKQTEAEIQLDDGTSLLIASESDTCWGASWHASMPIIDDPVDQYLQYVYQGKSVRLAVEAALQARYPE